MLRLVYWYGFIGLGYHGGSSGRKPQFSELGNVCFEKAAVRDLDEDFLELEILGMLRTIYIWFYSMDPRKI